MLRAAMQRGNQNLLTRISSKMSQHNLHMSSLNDAKKAVIFDMGGVIIPSPVPLVAAFAKKHSLDQKQMDELLFDGGDNSIWGKLECGMINSTKFSELLNTRAKELFGKDCEDEIISMMMKNKKYSIPHPEMISAIKQLRNNGIKTALLTNNFFMADGTSTLSSANEFDVVSCILIFSM